MFFSNKVKFDAHFAENGIIKVRQIDEMFVRGWMDEI